MNHSTEAPTATLDTTIAGLKHLGPLIISGAARLQELAAKPVDWIWQDIAVGNTVCVLAGPSTGGKTTLAFLLALARANTGAPIAVCGRLVKPAPMGQRILLLEAEHNEESASRKILKSARLLGIGPEAVDRILLVARKTVKLGSPAWNDAVKLIKAGLISDIFVDTLAKMSNGDANSEQAQIENFDLIVDALEAGKPMGWVLVHTRKGDPTSLDDISGSNQRVAQADSVVLVKPERDDNNQVVASTMALLKAREEPDSWPDKARIVVSDDAVQFSTSGGADALPPGVSPLGGKILKFLRLQSELRGVNYIAKGVSRNKDDVIDELNALDDLGLAEPVADGVSYGGKTFDGWRIMRTNHADPSHADRPHGAHADPETAHLTQLAVIPAGSHADPACGPHENPTMHTPPVSLEGIRGPHADGKEAAA